MLYFILYTLNLSVLHLQPEAFSVLLNQPKQKSSDFIFTNCC